MASRAKLAWNTTAKKHFDDLERIHSEVRGVGPGRRWRTLALNQSMFVFLVAQFQGYCRDLHTEAVDALCEWTGPTAWAGSTLGGLDERLVGMLADQLMRQREVDKGNPWPHYLYEDFGRLGIQLRGALLSYSPQLKEDLSQLESMLHFRNAVAHGEDVKLAEIRADGQVKATLGSFRKSRKVIDRIVAGLDSVVTGHLESEFGLSLPIRKG